MSDTRVTLREVHNLLEQQFTKFNKRFDMLEKNLTQNYVPRSEYDKDIQRLDRDIREARSSSDEQFQSLRQEIHDLYADMKTYTAKLVAGITALLTLMGGFLAFLIGG